MEVLRLEATGGVRLQLNVWPNAGPAFLLVHGLASNARLWDGVAVALAGRGFAVAAVDQRGHGRSDKPDGGYDFPTVTEDLVRVIEGLGWDRPVVVGQSWGGNVALELGWRRPEAVRGIGCVDGGWIELSRRFATVEECLVALAPPALEGRPLIEMATQFRRWHPDWPDLGIDGALANFEVREDGTVSPWLTRPRHLAILRELWAHRPSSRYPEMAIPVLLLPAEGVPPRPDDDKRALVGAAQAAIPVARTHWFSPADHDVHAQFPEQVAAVLAGAVDDGFWA